MSNFRFISYNENIEPIINQLNDNKDDWAFVSRMNDIGGDLDPYGFMPLVMALLKTKYEDPKDAEGLERTALYIKYNHIKQWLKSK